MNTKYLNCKQISKYRFYPKSIQYPPKDNHLTEFDHIESNNDINPLQTIGNDFCMVSIIASAFSIKRRVCLLNNNKDRWEGDMDSG